jgi:hypothetical protein
MDKNAERDRREADLKRFHPDQSAGNVLKHSDGRNSAQPIEDQVVGDVQGAGN